MPILDGIEASRRIKSMQKNKGLNEIIIIALTANVTFEDETECKKAEIDYFLSKPLSNDGFLSQMSLIFKKSKI
jgi:CheY-like chemotaxis protein